MSIIKRYYSLLNSKYKMILTLINSSFIQVQNIAESLFQQSALKA